MRTSKYVGKQFGNWKCTHIGLANVQTAKAKRPGKRNYYYIFERVTSDGLAEKMIRLNSHEASEVYKRRLDVEELANKRRRKRKFTQKLSYCFF